MPISGRDNLISADAAGEGRRVNFRVESAPFHGEAEEVDIGEMFRGGKLRKKAEGGVMMGTILHHESDEEIRVQKGDPGRGR
jgi:hypothetical protein